MYTFHAFICHLKIQKGKNFEKAIKVFEEIDMLILI
jgi:hypothetical protein